MNTHSFQQSANVEPQADFSTEFILQERDKNLKMCAKRDSQIAHCFFVLYDENKFVHRKSGLLAGKEDFP